MNFHKMILQQKEPITIWIDDFCTMISANCLTRIHRKGILYAPVTRMTGGKFLTGDLEWYLFQNGNSLKAAETAAAHRTHCRPPTLFSAAIAEKCAFLTRFAPIAGITRARKSLISVKNLKRNSKLTP